MKTDWAKLEGHTIRGVFPLLRLLGSSDGSAVFLSRAATSTPPDVALKLVPSISGQAELLLPRWQAAAALDHPHLLRLFEAGECEIGEQRYLYAVMEYAEQNLAQLLERRVLGPDEVREMLAPTLDALGFLHDSKRVQGGLKPSNVLVVGEQIKLASDAIGPASDGTSNGSDSRSTADDIWALGVMTCEALSRSRPEGLHAAGGDIVLPPDIPPTFREMITKCLSRNPEDRPDVARLQAWQKGGELQPMPAPATATRLVIRAKLVREDEITEPVELKAQWRPVPLIIAAVLLLAIIAAGVYFFAPSDTPVEANGPPAAPPVAAEIAASQEPATEAPATEVPPAPPPVPAARATASGSPSAVNEVIPVVPRSASQTIRGTIRVSVRVIVDADGNVVAATSENPGPSRYFERLSLEAAKKWMFAPAEAAGNRLMLVKFNYSRSGTTAKASPTQ